MPSTMRINHSPHRKCQCCVVALPHSARNVYRFRTKLTLLCIDGQGEERGDASGMRTYPEIRAGKAGGATGRGAKSGRRAGRILLQLSLRQVLMIVKRRAGGIRAALRPLQSSFPPERHRDFPLPGIRGFTPPGLRIIIRCGSAASLPQPSNTAPAPRRR